MAEHSWNKTHRLGDAWQMKQKLVTSFEPTKKRMVRPFARRDGAGFEGGPGAGDSDAATLAGCEGRSCSFLPLKLFLPHATFFNYFFLF